MRGILVSWRSLADGVGIRYANCPSDDELLIAAKERAREWARAFERVSRHALVRDDLVALEHEAVLVMRYHWSPEAVLPAMLELPLVVAAVNDFCRQAPLAKRCTRWTGDGVTSWSDSRRGVRFILGQPFLRAHRIVVGDDVPLRKVDAGGVAQVVGEATGPITLDMADWDDEMPKPNHYEIEKFVVRRRSRRVSGL